MKKFTLWIKIQKIYFFILFYPGFPISNTRKKNVVENFVYFKKK